MMNIVILDGGAANPGDLSWENIKQLGTLSVYDSSLQLDVIGRAKGADVLVVNKVLITEQILSQLPTVKCICLLATGYNNIDLDAASKYNVLVCNAVGYASASVAQHVFAMVLSLVNHISETSRSVHNGRWHQLNKWTFTDFPITELSGKTLGIYGLGKIGMAVAQVGLGFGMKVIAHKRTRGEAFPNIELCDVNTLLASCDILSLHAPLTSETQEFINRSSLSKMKNTAILINTGRGGLIHEPDLKEALLHGEIAAAGLDVLSEEPPPKDHILIGLDHCLITPHQAWAAKESRQRLIEIVAENISAFKAGNPVNVITS